MLSFLNQYAKNYTFSQNGEEGILLEVLGRLYVDINGGNCVEIGGSDGRFCSNTALLIRDYNWKGLFVESEYDLYLRCKANWQDNPLVRSQCSRVDERNINAFADERCDLLSLDTDGSDYRIFQGLQARPKIVIVEIDSSYSPDYVGFNSDGAGTYRNAVELGISKGYFLLCHTGNLVFVLNEYRHLFPEIEGDGLSNAELYFNKAWVMEGTG